MKRKEIRKVGATTSLGSQGLRGAREADMRCGPAGRRRGAWEGWKANGQRSRPKAQGPRPKDQGPRTRTQGPRTRTKDRRAEPEDSLSRLRERAGARVFAARRLTWSSPPRPGAPARPWA